MGAFDNTKKAVDKADGGTSNRRPQPGLPPIDRSTYVEPPPMSQPFARLKHQLSAAFTDPTSGALIGGPMGVIPKALGPARAMAPVTNKRPWPGSDINIYELTEDITDASGKVLHPKNSTMADKTLREYGYDFPQ